MLVQIELEVRDIIEQVLADLRDDQMLLDEVFGSRPPDEREEIAQFFGQRLIPVHLGYPRGAADLPAYYVTLGSSRESMQPIGSLQESEKIQVSGIARYKETEGAFFDSQVRLSSIAADNANLPVWMGEVARWGLLRYRDTLDDRGLVQQTLTVMDFEPAPTWLPTLAFRRDVALMVTHFAGVVRVLPAIRQVDVAASPADDPTTVFRVSITN